MDHLSYIEINVVCMLLLGIIMHKQFVNRSIISSAQIYMKRLILASCILCASDILAVICRGQMFPGARILIEVSNLIYFVAMPLISMFWLEYVCAKVGKVLSNTSKAVLIAPVILFGVVAATNPFTQFLFSIDDTNRYVRGPGVFLHWIVSWSYLLIAGAVSYIAYKSAQSWSKRSQCRPLLIFIIAPTICCTIQMLVYGISAVQVGITLSIVLVNFQLLDNRVSIDELTGINNRKEMITYVDRTINKHKPVSLNVIMIDINRFKQINDTLGHNVGDNALQDVATALKKVCEQSSEHMFLCRFGGDEFVIVSRNIDPANMEQLHSTLKESVSSIANRPYQLSISVGNAAQVCENMADFESCLKQADASMYAEKQKFKALSV